MSSIMQYEIPKVLSELVLFIDNFGMSFPMVDTELGCTFNKDIVL